MMKTHTRQKILRHSAFLATIIFASIFLRYFILRLDGILTTEPIYKVLYWIFPHEIFAEINNLLLTVYYNPYDIAFPFLSLVFCLLLFTGFIFFKRNPGNTRFIVISCYTLIISILSSIPLLFIYYSRAIANFISYESSQSSEGFQAITNDFRQSQKPSPVLLAFQIIILTLYIIEAIYLLSLVRKYKRNRRMHQQKI